MSKELNIIQNEDGTFSEYDDTFDITIHCKSEEEQNEVLAKLNAPKALEQDPCEDAISRQAVLDLIEREEFKGDAISEIEKLPPVTPQPKIGRWIYHDGYIPYKHECSECGKRFGTDSNYCPNCGAKMQEG